MSKASVLRLAEAARYVRVSEKTLREMARAGHVPCQRVGREWRFLRAVLDAWLAGNSGPPIPNMVTDSATQLYLLGAKPNHHEKTNEWGTFKDSLRAPIHNWFTYPAGFSYKAVESSLTAHGIVPLDTIYDPFMGSGTTNVTAKNLAMNSYGVEAHPFVYQIAKVKLNWEVDLAEVDDIGKKVAREAEQRTGSFPHHLEQFLAREFPELVTKCYQPRILYDLLTLRDAIKGHEYSPEVQDFLNVGLTCLLRQVSSAATGWPYIAPNKIKTTSLHKDAIGEFARIISKMIRDVQLARRNATPGYQSTKHHLIEGDSRNTKQHIPDKCIEHVFTSPPYLNNFDYADRTRLELYFFGQAKKWDDISRKVRTKLITSATTQIARNDPKYALSTELQRACPEVYDFLSKSVEELAKLRLNKGGKKSYDHLVSGYFSDMFLVLGDVLRVLKRGRKAVFVLGDSAPYGVHIPTDELIGKIALGIGFSGYSIQILRSRGDKWKANPMRHHVKLRESIVTLTKE